VGDTFEMKLFLKHIVSTISVLLLSATLSWGDDFQKAYYAYQKGEYTIAFEGFKKLAEQGDTKAQYNLGVMLEKGHGTIQDYKEAFKWHTLAAEKGDSDAQNYLGFLYGRGRGVLQDKVLAHMWFNISSSNGSEHASENRDKLAKNMTPSQIEKAQDLARECVKKNYKGC